MRVTRELRRPRFAVVACWWVFGVVEVWVLHTAHGPRPLASLALTIGAAAAVLAWTGRLFAAAALTVLCWVPPALADASVDSLSLLALSLVVAYVAGQVDELPRSLGAVASVLAGPVVAAAKAGESAFNDLWTLAVVGAVWLAGSVVHRHRSAREAAEATAERASAEAEERVRDAVRAERSRMARDLHDVISHGVTLMTVQAGAAARVVGTRPDAAREALTEIQRAGARTIDELRRLLLVLNDRERTAEGASSTDWNAILRAARMSGLRVEFAADDIEDLPASVVRTLHRALQEALVNARRHAGECAVTATVTRHAGKVTLDVCNEAGRGGGSDGTGHGLLGLRDRVEIYGGTLTAGPVAGCGWRLVACVPTAAS